MNLLLALLAPCWSALSPGREQGVLTPEALFTCAEIAIRAPFYGVSAEVAVEWAFLESRFRRYRKSYAGAYGPLQVLPRYWCPLPCFDPVGAGLRAVRHYTTRYKDLKMARCRYSGRRKCG